MANYSFFSWKGNINFLFGRGWPLLHFFYLKGTNTYLFFYLGGDGHLSIFLFGRGWPPSYLSMSRLFGKGCLSTYLLIYSFIYLFIYLYIYLFIDLFTYLFICLFSYLSIYLFGRGWPFTHFAFWKGWPPIYPFIGELLLGGDCYSSAFINIFGGGWESICQSSFGGDGK